jgi:hypothetical protein
MNAIQPTADDATSLLARVNNRDAGAWQQIVRLIGPFLLRWCQVARLTPGDGEEVACKILADIWRDLASFHKDERGPSFRAWVYSRSRVHLPALPAECPLSDTHAWQRRTLLLALCELQAANDNDVSFRAFCRTAVDGMSIPEVAQLMGLRPWQIRQYRLIWTGRLRERLQQFYGALLDG